MIGDNGRSFDVLSAAKAKANTDMLTQINSWHWSQNKKVQTKETRASTLPLYHSNYFDIGVWEAESNVLHSLYWNDLKFDCYHDYIDHHYENIDL